MLKKIFCIAAVNVLTLFTTLAQVPPQASLETILTEAEKQTVNYQETFKNLLAVEKKTFEEFNRDGELDKKTTVESNFLVYQSPKNPKVPLEVRNVIKVNEELVPNSQAESDKFFAELEKEKTAASELDRIAKTSSKYDKTLEVSGMTLYDGIILAPNLRPYFDFRLDGTESYQGSPVYVVSFRQTKASPYVIIDGKSLTTNEPNLDYAVKIPGSLKKKDAFVNGKLWIDASTYQIRREERNLTVQGDTPVTLVESIFDYQPSSYGILLPKQITFTENDVKKKDGKLNAVRDTKLTLDYSNFRKSDVEVIILDDPE